MNNKYVIGVDGGNSKTDYFLFDLDGNYIDHLHTGTCSHERFPDGYAGAERAMKDQLHQLLASHGLSPQTITAGSFGLAGADIPPQKARLNEVVRRLGMTHFALDNDAFLGIKAGSEKGYGVCSINGSGMSTAGISPAGERLQIGGVGSELSGDEAGGFYLARRVLRAVYDFLYRLGHETAMTEPVMELLRIPSKADYIETVLEGSVKRSLPTTELVQILFRAADQGDSAALEIVDRSAEQLARSAAGCLKHLNFDDDREVDVVLAGSVWVKVESPLLFDGFRRKMEQFTRVPCRYTFLQVPPAAGAVLWALELAEGSPVKPELRRKVIEHIQGVQLS
ncbi:kinase [Paenibacillus faecis]|uniref:N-acetylglucosamine kinase n=1 Tax=Paenibacillus faecis TaxID=862114 RepID=UPI001B13D36A|nr:BadF/BadG/BcrA/BcrD ATPase family protein [Paenibacillus faecis]GIO83337.1 kinase [Paenibacillus faecis]